MEWEAGAQADMIADAIVATLMQVILYPATLDACSRHMLQAGDRGKWQYNLFTFEKPKT